MFFFRKQAFQTTPAEAYLDLKEIYRILKDTLAKPNKGE